MPSIETARADLQFEAEALAALEQFELTGEHVPASALDAVFAEALALAVTTAEK